MQSSFLDAVLISGCSPHFWIQSSFLDAVLIPGCSPHFWMQSLFLDAVLILPQIKLNLQRSHCAYFFSTLFSQLLEIICWQSLGYLSLQMSPLQFLPLLTLAIFLCACLLFIKTPNIGLGSILVQYDLILTNYMCKDLISNKIMF